MINNCRLWLQIHTLAEITMNDGTEILKEAYHGTSTESTQQPALWTKTNSTLTWPHQERPPQQAWRAWKAMLKTIIRHGLTLKKPLGTFYSTTPSTHRHWNEHPPTTSYHHTQLDPIHHWTENTFDQTTKATNIDIIIQTLSTYEIAVFCWSLAIDHAPPIIRYRAKCPADLYAAKNKPTLLALGHCLNTLQQEHYYRHAPTSNKLIRIWLPCKKTIRKSIHYDKHFPTASSAMKEEDELYKHVATTLQHFPKISLLYLPSTCPDNILTTSNNNYKPLHYNRQTSTQSQENMMDLLPKPH